MTEPQRIVVGNLVTMDPAQPRAEAMALDGARIVAVGTLDKALASMPPGATVTHAPGAAVVPGLVDSHVHMLWAGLDASRLSLSGVRSVDEVLDRIREYAARRPGDGWLAGSADFDAENLAEERLPTRGELDRATAGRPLFLDRRSHDGLVNSAALAAAGIDATTPDPVGGVIERDAAGAATGLLVERPAVELVTAVMPPTSIDELLDALERIQPVYHAAGLTGVVDPALLPDELAAFAELRRRDGLTVRTTAMPLAQTSLGGAEAVARLQAGEHRPSTGDEWLRFGAVKVFFDGGGSLGTALLREPWPGVEGDYRGNQTVPTEALAEIARACAASGWSLGVHTVGGAAIDIVLGVFSEVDRETPIRDRRFSLIHAYLWPSAENVATAARLGIVVATQPPMQWQFGPGLVAKFGAERIGRATPVRSWLDGGVTVAGGSDGPGIPPEPLFGMWQARTRRIDGTNAPVGIEEAVSAEQALALYTTGACYAALAEHERGSLRAGMLADWVALSADPLDATDDELFEASVLQTVVGGRVVYGEA
jgi:predicted amidohydrolase YtcJ